MANKATHHGTCQICGHFQKLPGGTLSKHGYTKRWGFFAGVCSGAHEQPFELSCDLIKDAIARAERVACELNARADKVEAERQSIWVHEYIPATFNRGERQSRYEWREMNLEEVEFSFNDVCWTPRNGGRKQSHTTYSYVGEAGSEERKQSIIAHCNKNRADAYRALAKQHMEYAEWQRGRIENWKPTALTPVAA